jgi:proline iminopeptidase
MHSVRIASSEGFGLHATLSGAGRVLLGLHGGPGGTGAEYMQPLHRLASFSRRVVVFDQLGVGHSEVPPADYVWTLERAVADVEAVRRDLRVEQVDLLGHSWGGMLALQYTLDHPESVGRLVLSNTCASTKRFTMDVIAQMSKVLSPSELGAALTADTLGDHTSPEYLDALAKWLGGYGTTDEFLPALNAEALDPGPAGHGLWGDRMWFATGAVRGWDVEARLSEITAPTLVIHGGHDMSSMEANRAMAEGIRDTEWLAMNGNSHTPFEEKNSATYLSIIRMFLNGWELR